MSGHSDAHTAARDQALRERDAGAVFFVNHSGGQDSQKTLIDTAKVVPPEQIVVIHASLSRAEWPGALEKAQEGAQALGVPFIVAKAGKTFQEMVERRFATRPEVPCWPSESTRQCTSDLKRDPIEREIRHYTKARGLTRIVNVMGLRAEESRRRARACPFAVSQRGSKAGRHWTQWLPIHDQRKEEVVQGIADAGQERHPAYALGNERLSCIFCIYSSAGDARNGAIHHPELYAEYVALKRKTGYTMHVSQRSLPELTGITPDA